MKKNLKAIVFIGVCIALGEVLAKIFWIGLTHL